MIIGLTGRNASGKTEVSEYLKSRGFEYHSLSDEIREEIRSRGQEITREVLICVGNELRAKFGPGVLAERVLLRLGHERNYVVDSIRNPTEVQVLRRRKDFVLLGLEAEEQLRFERSRARAREGAARTLQQFVGGGGAGTEQRGPRLSAAARDAPPRRRVAEQRRLGRGAAPEAGDPDPAVHGRLSASGLGRVLHEHRSGGCLAQQLHQAEGRRHHRQGQTGGLDGLQRHAARCQELQRRGLPAM